MKKLLLVLWLLALSAGILLGLNTVQASLFFRLHVTNSEILWDQTDQDYAARFVLAQSGDTLTVAVYQKSLLGWKYLCSNSGEDYAVTALSLYSRAQKDTLLATLRNFCMVAATKEKLEETYAQIDQKQRNAFVAYDAKTFSPKSDAVLLFGYSDEDFGSEDLIAAAMPLSEDGTP